MATMTKEKPTPTRRRGRKPLGESKKESIVSLRGSREFKEWLDELLYHLRVKRAARDMADVIERAVILLAEKEGFKPEAPPR